MFKNHFTSISSFVILACFLIPILTIASACAGVQQAANSAKEKASEAMSHLNSSTLTPLSSSYPADIIGRVTVTGLVQDIIEGGSGVLNPKGGDVLWVVNISVKNKTYLASVPNQNCWTYYWWAITDGTNIYRCPEYFKALPGTPIPSLDEGQTRQLLTCFEVPSNLTLSNAQIVYQGQQPYSYGKLTGGEKVAAYAFLSQKAVNQVSPLIPYGTYVASAAGFTASITLNKDGTYSTDDPYNGKKVGTYTVSKDFITIYDPITHAPTQQKYTYSAQFKCLYLYPGMWSINDNPFGGAPSQWSDTPVPFYKQ
ncbi:MAG: hypothetical protein ABR958_00425 [Dehalococcoidales bacterium]